MPVGAIQSEVSLSGGFSMLFTLFNVTQNWSTFATRKAMGGCCFLAPPCQAPIGPRLTCFLLLFWGDSSVMPLSPKATSQQRKAPKRSVVRVGLPGSLRPSSVLCVLALIKSHLSSWKATCVAKSSHQMKLGASQGAHLGVKRVHLSKFLSRGFP